MSVNGKSVAPKQGHCCGRERMLRQRSVKFEGRESPAERSLMQIAANAQFEPMAVIANSRCACTRHEFLCGSTASDAATRLQIRPFGTTAAHSWAQIHDLRTTQTLTDIPPMSGLASFEPKPRISNSTQTIAQSDLRHRSGDLGNLLFCNG